MASNEADDEGGGGDEEGKTKRKPSAALSQPVQPDAQLAAVVGEDALPRPQVVKKVWDYIKAGGLQDQKDKRMINADDKLRPIFDGRDQVSMFEMTKLISKHLAASKRS